MSYMCTFCGSVDHSYGSDISAPCGSSEGVQSPKCRMNLLEERLKIEARLVEINESLKRGELSLKKGESS